MERRTWLKTVAVALANRFVMGEARAQSSSSPRPRVFQLLTQDEGEHPATILRDTFVHEDKIYYLATESTHELSASVWKIGCRTFDGKFVWRRRLPLGLYSGIEMSEIDTLLLLSFRAYQGHPMNSVYSVTGVDTQPPRVEWLTAVPAAGGGPVGAMAFLHGAHFGGIFNGALSMTTPNDLAKGIPAASLALPGKLPIAFHLLEYAGSLWMVNLATAEVWVFSSAASSVPQFTVSGPAVSTAQNSLSEAVAAQARYPNTAINLIAATGIVGKALHMLLLPFKESLATYAWCNQDFSVAGSTTIDLTFVRAAAPIKILQLATETALVFSDGSVAAFPIPT